MEGVALSSLTLPLALLSLAACSTAALPISQFEEAEEPPPSSTGPAVDAGGMGPPRDGGLPARDASMVLPPLIDATVQNIPRDAGRPRPPDARLPTPPDAGLPTPPDMVLPSACAVRNPPSCTPILTRCVPVASATCAYPDPADREGLLLRTCTPSGPDSITSVTPVPCRRSCFAEIPSSFEELKHEDCARRGVVDCTTFPTDQIAVDRTLEDAAQACGLTEHHLGLIFTANGCGRALFAREIKDPAIRCIAKRINEVRFSCKPLCAIANSDE